MSNNQRKPRHAWLTGLLSLVLGYLGWCVVFLDPVKPRHAFATSWGVVQIRQQHTDRSTKVPGAGEYTTSGGCTHFGPADLNKSGGGPNYIIDSDFCDDLDAARDEYGEQLVTSSGYRPPVINDAVGGDSLSLHPYGRSIDIGRAGNAPSVKWDSLDSSEQDQIISAVSGQGLQYENEGDHLHVELGNYCDW